MDTDLRNKIDRIWEYFWTGGITNPLSVIEQITYLLFMNVILHFNLDVFSTAFCNSLWNSF